MSKLKVAVIGTGVIGASWVTHFLAHGLEVVASDPAPDAEARLRSLVAQQWPMAVALGAVDGASPEHVRFTAEAAEAVKNADFVQENGPERLEIKRSLYAALDEAAPADAILASSSSGIPASEFQGACKHPERVLIGHPFNPPHLIPLVEVVGGQQTAPEAIEKTLAFYSSVGKKPIHIRREVKGHVGNRLQAALWREAFYLVSTGVASIAEIDMAIAHGPGLRWALLGPFLNLHLSGGAQGLAHTLDHLGPPIESWWRDLGDISLTPRLKEEAVNGVAAELAGRDLSALVAQRDDILIKLLALKSAAEQLP